MILMYIIELHVGFVYFFDRERLNCVGCMMSGGRCYGYILAMGNLKREHGQTHVVIWLPMQLATFKNLF